MELPAALRPPAPGPRRRRARTRRARANARGIARRLDPGSIRRPDLDAVRSTARAVVLELGRGSIGSRRSRWSLLCYRSVASAFSVASLLSVGSAGSFASVGSVLSVGSAGSILSVGSAGSICSIGAAGGFFSVGSPAADDPARSRLDEREAATVRRLSSALALCAMASATLDRGA